LEVVVKANASVTLNAGLLASRECEITSPRWSVSTTSAIAILQNEFLVVYPFIACGCLGSSLTKKEIITVLPINGGETRRNFADGLSRRRQAHMAATVRCRVVVESDAML